MTAMKMRLCVWRALVSQSEGPAYRTSGSLSAFFNLGALLARPAPAKAGARRFGQAAALSHAALFNTQAAAAHCGLMGRRIGAIYSLRLYAGGNAPEPSIPIVSGYWLEGRLLPAALAPWGSCFSLTKRFQTINIQKIIRQRMTGVGKGAS